MTVRKSARERERERETEGGRAGYMPSMCWHVHVFVCVCVCVRACVRVCVCVRARIRTCVGSHGTHVPFAAHMAYSMFFPGWFMRTYICRGKRQKILEKKKHVPFPAHIAQSMFFPGLELGLQLLVYEALSY